MSLYCSMIPSDDEEEPVNTNHTDEPLQDEEVVSWHVVIVVSVST